MSIVLAQIVLILLMSVALSTYAQQMPDSQMTPGIVDRSLSLQMICTKGSARDERNVSEAEKKAVYALYGIAKCTGYCSGRQGCEIDHLISLELGGSNDIANLWPQPYDGVWSAHHKDQLENRLHELVCTHKMTLGAAQEEISTDWVASYRKRIGTTVKPMQGPARCSE